MSEWKDTEEYTYPREWSEEGIKERFRTLPKAESCAEQKIWTVVDED